MKRLIYSHCYASKMGAIMHSNEHGLFQLNVQHSPVVSNLVYVVRISMIKVTVLSINNFVGAKVYYLKVASLCFFCVKWT